jgi:hypothetical protein
LNRQHIKAEGEFIKNQFKYARAPCEKMYLEKEFKAAEKAAEEKESKE